MDETKLKRLKDSKHPVVDVLNAMLKHRGDRGAASTLLCMERIVKHRKIVLDGIQEGSTAQIVSLKVFIAELEA